MYCYIEFPISPLECQCNLTGTVNGSGVCDKVSGQCPCKELLTGRTCNQCQVGNILLFIHLITGPVSNSFALLRNAIFFVTKKKVLILY